MKRLYYWANDVSKNSGEGILANNFLKLLKNHFRRYKLININKFKFKNNFFYNYFLPIYGAFKLLILSRRYPISYVNYLPIWNWILLIILPKKTILGPVTGTKFRNEFIYKIFSIIGIFLIKRKYKKILLSNDHYTNILKSKKIKIYDNFLLYDFKKTKINNKKKFDFIFYLRKNRNKGNKFLLYLINKLSSQFKIAIIGDKKIELNHINIKYFGKLNRKKARSIISSVRYSVATKENLFSFFTQDCLSFDLTVFYDKKLSLDSDIKTNQLIRIDFKNIKKTMNIIRKIANKNKKKKILKIKDKRFNDYFK